MINKKSLLYGAIILIIITYLGLSIVLGPRLEMNGLRIACNDDAAGLLITYLAGEDSGALEAVSYTHLTLPTIYPV